MTLRKILPLLFVLVFNLWLIKIIRYNVFIGVSVILGSVFIYLSILGGVKKYFYLSTLFILILMIFQYKTSTVNSLLFLNENEKIAQLQRMRGYPRELYRFANWLEQRKEALIFYKMEENFAEVVDPNQYFFANHPRERVGITEYEKFPYILLPFFVLGIFFLKRKDISIFLLSVSPVIILTIIGNSNPIGPFSLFPFLAVFISRGLEPVFKNRRYFMVFILFFILVFIQTVSYATY